MNHQPVTAVCDNLSHPNQESLMSEDLQKYVCTVCGYVYDPAKGEPASGIAPGTPFSQIPEDWVCPDCGVAKSDFEPMA